MGSFKIGRWAAALSLVTFGGVFTGACGGGGAEGTTSGTTTGTSGGKGKPPAEVYTPPAVNDGTGIPANATGFTCQSPFDCDGWYCNCSDGDIVYGAVCQNAYCLDAAGTCAGACTTPFWDHGSWTGSTSEWTPDPTTAGGAGSGGVGGSSGNGSGGVGGGVPLPTCGDTGAPCSDSSECCSYFCNFDTCN
jgi:hypothetical protein